MTSSLPNKAKPFRFTIRSLILVTAFISLLLGLRTNFVYGERSHFDVTDEVYTSGVTLRASWVPPIMAIVGCLYWLVSNTKVRPSPGETALQGVTWGGLTSFFAASAWLFEFLLPTLWSSPKGHEYVILGLLFVGIEVFQGICIGLVFVVAKAAMDKWRSPKPNRTEDLYGALLLLIAIGMLMASNSYDWGWILWWPAFSFACVSMAYFIGSKEPLGKRNGIRPLLSSLLLFPYLAFAYGIWMLQVLFSKESAFNAVNDVLIVARRLRAKEYPEDVTLVCDLTAEFCDPFSIRHSDCYYSAPILDAGAIVPYELTFLVRELKLEPGGCLLIHCANGHGRTGMVAAAWLIGYGYAQNVDEALAQLQKVRPGIHLRDYQRQAVEIATPQLLKISQ